MESFDHMTVTHIDKPITVFSQQGETMHTQQRKSYGLSLCLSGQITYIWQGQTYVSGPGQAVILPKGGSYTLRRDKTGVFPLINFQCDHFPIDGFAVIRLRQPQSCIQQFDALRELFLLPGNRLQIFSRFYALLDQILGDQHPEKTMRPTLQYIQQHLSDPALSNGLLARQAGISEVYFRKLFAKQFATTPRQYILQLRLSKAMQLLTDTDLTVTAIAEGCGFGSVYHFCRSFKKHIGVTPKEYASENRRYKL